MQEVKRVPSQKEAIQYLDKEDEKRPRPKRRDLIMDKDIFTGEFIIYDVS